MANSSLKLRLLILLCLLPLALLPGCGEETVSEGGIVISPSRITVGINQSQFFTALGRSGGGFLIATSPTWNVTGGIGVIRTSGQFLAGSLEGTGQIVASDGTLTGTADVTITKHGWLQGKVTDTNAGTVVGIRVFLQESPTLGDETDQNGNYLISDIPAGTYLAVINPQQVWQGATQEVTIGEGKTVIWSPTLSTPTVTSTTTTLPF